MKILVSVLHLVLLPDEAEGEEDQREKEKEEEAQRKKEGKKEEGLRKGRK